MGFYFFFFSFPFLLSIPSISTQIFTFFSFIYFRFSMPFFFSYFKVENLIIHLRSLSFLHTRFIVLNSVVSNALLHPLTLGGFCFKLSWKYFLIPLVIFFWLIEYFRDVLLNFYIIMMFPNFSSLISYFIPL